MICTQAETLEQIKACVKPHNFLTYIGYVKSEDCFLNPIFVLIYEDAKGIRFARQPQDRFVLPVNTYRREILGDSIDNYEDLKDKPATNYYSIPFKKEVCSVLNYLYTNEIH